MSESESLPQPATTEEAPAEPQEPQKLPPTEPEVIAKPKRKPRAPKKSKVIAVDVILLNILMIRHHHLHLLKKSRKQNPGVELKQNLLQNL